MKVTTTPFEGLLILEPAVWEDSRGYFFESYNEKAFRDLGIDMRFVQDNQSRSGKGVLRGLHFQRPPRAQSKLVRVLTGVIQDVVVDLRKGQPTFLKHFSMEISAENKRQLLVPKGFAHGFLVLSDAADVLYKCDDFYHRESEGGIRYDDPRLSIPWQMPAEKMIVSDKDRNLPGFSPELVF